MNKIPTFKLTVQFSNQIKNAIEQSDDQFIINSLKDINPADICSLLEELNVDESKYVVDLMDLEIRAQIINGLEPETQKLLLKKYFPEELSEILNYLDSDDVADILNNLPTKKKEEVLVGIDAELALQVIDLLRYEENEAGGLMAKEVIKANINWSVVQCVEEIRKQAETVTKLYTVFVVDKNDKLMGTVALHDIVIADANKLVADILDEEVISVETFLSEKEVADIMQKYDLESVPVVNVQGQLVGRITIDDILDVISQQADTERQLMSGISEDIENSNNIWKNTRARLPWLIIGIIGGMLSARFIGLFELELSKVTAIAFFVPLIQATGGNVGIQSSSIIVQRLANSNFKMERIWKRFTKVILVALLNGAFLAVFVLCGNWLIFRNNQLSLIVSCALFFVVIIASLIGTITPIILNYFNVNPALASGPFITTINDLTGLSVYFAAIHLML